MGVVGQEIVKLNVSELINDLNKGVAAEINDAFRYLLLSKMVSGPGTKELADLFAQMSQSEWNHLGLLVERIVQLNGQPLLRPSVADEYSYTPYIEPPADPRDVRRIVEDSLESERAAIRYWQELYERTQHADPVTALMAAQALVDEVEDEHNLERYIEGWHRY